MEFAGNRPDQLSRIANTGGFDEFGFTGTLPPHEVSADMQLRSEQIAAQRNDALARQAIGMQRGGLRYLESYRPGGAAAMLSPYFSNMANLTMARRREAPDLMFWDRRHEARRSQRRARNMAYLQMGVGAASSIASAGLAGGNMGGMAAGGAPRPPLGAGMGGYGGGAPRPGGYAAGGVVQPTGDPQGSEINVAEKETEFVVPLSKAREFGQIATGAIDDASLVQGAQGLLPTPQGGSQAPQMSPGSQQGGQPSQGGQDQNAQDAQTVAQGDPMGAATAAMGVDPITAIVLDTEYNLHSDNFWDGFLDSINQDSDGYDHYNYGDYGQGG